MKQGKCWSPPQVSPPYMASPQLSPQYPLDFGDLEENLGLQKTKTANVKNLGKGISSLLVGVSSRSFLLLFSTSGIGESRSMEFTISSASRASTSAALRGSCSKGLGAEEVTSAEPLASRSALLQIHTRVKKYSIQRQNLKQVPRNLRRCSYH